jgi:hypothetical protein
MPFGEIRHSVSPLPFHSNETIAYREGIGVLQHLALHLYTPQKQQNTAFPLARQELSASPLSPTTSVSWHEICANPTHVNPHSFGRAPNRLTFLICPVPDISRERSPRNVAPSKLWTSSRTTIDHGHTCAHRRRSGTEPTPRRAARVREPKSRPISQKGTQRHVRC